MRTGGFFVGAVGGLALAVLLVGVASVLPQSNSTPLAGSAQETQLTTSCSTCQASSHSSTQPKAQNSSANAPVFAGGAVATTTATRTAVSTSSTSAVFAGSVGAQSLGNGALSGAQPAAPASRLTVLQGESVAGLVATLSPLLVGLLVAVLVYGAYTRRQDSS